MRTIAVIIVVLSVLCGPGLVKAQDNTKYEVYEKIHIPLKKPIPYPFTREADVMYEKVIWRMVDLREKMNLPLYYPTNPIGDRMNLIRLIFSGIDNEGLQVYDAYKEDEFSVPLSKEQIERQMGNVEQNKQVPDANGNMRDTVISGDRKYDEVKKVLIKEKWFFDRNYSTMQVRIVGLCPIRLYKREVKGVETDDANAEMEMAKTFWVKYSEFRNLFSKNPVFNRFNDAQPVSFDDLFMQRRFNGYVYAESNVYDNRRVQDYTAGFETLLEADRIKNDLINFEIDLWEY
jgi:gliding motility associated protien GldN